MSWRLVIQRRDEDGATLLLVLAFVFVLGLLFVALGGFAANAFKNTSNFKYQRTLTTDAETIVTASMQYMRTNYGTSGFYNLSPQPCPGISTSIGSANPASGSTNSVVLECIGNAQPRSATTRTVDLYACQPGTSASSCPTSSSVVLHAQVQYDDIATSGAYQCDGTSSATCGEAITVSQWDVTYADS